MPMYQPSYYSNKWIINYPVWTFTTLESWIEMIYYLKSNAWPTISWSWREVSPLLQRSKADGISSRCDCISIIETSWGANIGIWDSSIGGSCLLRTTSACLVSRTRRSWYPSADDGAIKSFSVNSTVSWACASSLLLFTTLRSTSWGDDWSDISLHSTCANFLWTVKYLIHYRIYIWYVFCLRLKEIEINKLNYYKQIWEGKKIKIAKHKIRCLIVRVCMT